jgi:hypothetical protein
VPKSWEWYYDDVATGETGSTLTKTLGPGDHTVCAMAVTTDGKRKPIEFEFSVE